MDTVFSLVNCADGGWASLVGNKLIFSSIEKLALTDRHLIDNSVSTSDLIDYSLPRVEQIWRSEGRVAAEVSLNGKKTLVLLPENRTLDTHNSDDELSIAERENLLHAVGLPFERTTQVALPPALVYKFKSPIVDIQLVNWMPEVTSIAKNAASEILCFFIFHENGDAVVWYRLRDLSSSGRKKAANKKKNTALSTNIEAKSLSEIGVEVDEQPKSITFDPMGGFALLSKFNLFENSVPDQKLLAAHFEPVSGNLIYVVGRSSTPLQYNFQPLELSVSIETPLATVENPTPKAIKRVELHVYPSNTFDMPTSLLEKGKDTDSNLHKFVSQFPYIIPVLDIGLYLLSPGGLSIYIPPSPSEISVIEGSVPYLVHCTWSRLISGCPLSVSIPTVSSNSHSSNGLIILRDDLSVFFLNNDAVRAGLNSFTPTIPSARLISSLGLPSSVSLPPETVISIQTNSFSMMLVAEVPFCLPADASTSDESKINVTFPNYSFLFDIATGLLLHSADLSLTTSLLAAKRINLSPFRKPFSFKTLHAPSSLSDGSNPFSLASIPQGRRHRYHRSPVLGVTLSGRIFGFNPLSSTLPVYCRRLSEAIMALEADSTEYTLNSGNLVSTRALPSTSGSLDSSSTSLSSLSNPYTVYPREIAKILRSFACRSFLFSLMGSETALHGTPEEAAARVSRVAPFMGLQTESVSFLKIAHALNWAVDARACGLARELTHWRPPADPAEPTPDSRKPSHCSLFSFPSSATTTGHDFPPEPKGYTKQHATFDPFSRHLVTARVAWEQAAASHPTVRALLSTISVESELFRAGLELEPPSLSKEAEPDLVPEMNAISTVSKEQKEQKEQKQGKRQRLTAQSLLGLSTADKIISSDASAPPSPTLGALPSNRPSVLLLDSKSMESVVEVLRQMGVDEPTLHSALAPPLAGAPSSLLDSLSLGPGAFASCSPFAASVLSSPQAEGEEKEEKGDLVSLLEGLKEDVLRLQARKPVPAAAEPLLQFLRVQNALVALLNAQSALLADPQDSAAAASAAAASVLLSSLATLSTEKETSSLSAENKETVAPHINPRSSDAERSSSMLSQVLSLSFPLLLSDSEQMVNSARSAARISLRRAEMAAVETHSLKDERFSVYNLSELHSFVNRERNCVVPASLPSSSITDITRTEPSVPALATRSTGEEEVSPLGYTSLALFGLRPRALPALARALESADAQEAPLVSAAAFSKLASASLHDGPAGAAPAGSLGGTNAGLGSVHPCVAAARSAVSASASSSRPISAQLLDLLPPIQRSSFSSSKSGCRCLETLGREPFFGSDLPLSLLLPDPSECQCMQGAAAAVAAGARARADLVEMGASGSSVSILAKAGLFLDAFHLLSSAEKAELATLARAQGRGAGISSSEELEALVEEACSSRTLHHHLQHVMLRALDEIRTRSGGFSSPGDNAVQLGIVKKEVTIMEASWAVPLTPEKLLCALNCLLPIPEGLHSSLKLTALLSTYKEAEPVGWSGLVTSAASLVRVSAAPSSAELSSVRQRPLYEEEMPEHFQASPTADDDPAAAVLSLLSPLAASASNGSVSILKNSALLAASASIGSVPFFSSASATRVRIWCEVFQQVLAAGNVPAVLALLSRLPPALAFADVAALLQSLLAAPSRSARNGVGRLPAVLVFPLLCLLAQAGEVDALARNVQGRVALTIREEERGGMIRMFK